MTDVWVFLLQTLSVSVVAVLLLIVKWLLSDKLSPRWQYAVWSVLALRIVLPVWMTGKYILLPLPLWLETVKGVVESSLKSTYSSPYMSIKIRFPLPWVSGKTPVSVTDWIFVIYAFGVLAMLIWYMVSYGRLRLLLRHGSPVSAEIRGQIETICGRYNLRSCRAVTVTGLPSAFVCGLLRPVLAIPGEMELDEKVLLHELLHLRYFDAAQSVVWSIFRSLHWCNPLLQYVFNQIGNDMEQLCDQRVLELLKGEQRREYGGMLLAMVNEKYPRAPGTTSLSNGAKNIARRIEAIARFKKYPKGMALVSICAVVVLLCASLFGTYDQSVVVGGGSQDDDWGFAKAMASARLARCTTVAGALDTYAKGIMYENGIYLAAASPLSAQEELGKEMTYNAKLNNCFYYHLQTCSETLSRDGYWIYNLRKLSGGGYEALLVFTADSLIAENGEGCRCDENGNPYKGVIVYPVKVSYDDAWVVTQNGERQVYPVSFDSDLKLNLQFGSWLLPNLAAYTASGKSGTVTIQIQSIYSVNNTIASGGSFAFLGTTSYDETIKPKAEFASCSLTTKSRYMFGGSADERKCLRTVELQTTEMKDKDSIPEFPSISHEGNSNGGNCNGSSWVSNTVTDDWDGVVSGYGGGTWSGGINYNSLDIPSGYAAQISWNGELIETLILKEASADGSATAY